MHVPLIFYDQEGKRDDIRLIPVAHQLYLQWENCLFSHFLIRIKISLELIESLISHKKNGCLSSSSGISA